jgi:MFS family permease
LLDDTKVRDPRALGKSEKPRNLGDLGCGLNGAGLPADAQLRDLLYHEQKLHLDGTAKPGIQKTLDCDRDLRNLCSRPRQRRDLEMNIFTGSPFLILLMSTVASLPFFLFTLPAGVLADKVDRQKLICFINVGLAATPVGLAVLGWLHLLNPYLILLSVFFIGVGFAFNAPAWTSIVPQVVSDAELPSAATLSGLQFNISGIIGPALGGLLVPLAGANFVFALNAACFLLVVLATRQWKQAAAPAKLPSESFFESFGTAIHFARYAPGFQVVLARNFLFALLISVVPALMPVVGLKELHLSSSNLGLLFTSMGAGSVIGAVFIILWLRARLSPDCLTLSANLPLSWFTC